MGKADDILNVFLSIHKQESKHKTISKLYRGLQESSKANIKLIKNKWEREGETSKTKDEKSLNHKRKAPL